MEEHHVRPPQARPRTRPVRLRPADRRRPAVLAARRCRRPARLGELHRRGGTKSRLPAGLFTCARQARAVRDLRPLGEVPRRHVPTDGHGRRATGPAAEHLPAPRADVPLPLAQLPRAPAAVLRARRAVPRRTLRRDRRPEPGPRHATQRRAHLLPPRPGRRGGRQRARPDQPGVRRHGDQRVPLRPGPPVRGRRLRQPGSKYVGDAASWAEPPDCFARSSTTPASTTRTRRATPRSTDRRSTSR